jgi:hypothetical protein
MPSQKQLQLQGNKKNNLRVRFGEAGLTKRSLSTTTRIPRGATDALDRGGSGSLLKSARVDELAKLSSQRRANETHHGGTGTKLGNEYCLSRPLRGNLGGTSTTEFFGRGSPSRSRPKTGSELDENSGQKRSASALSPTKPPRAPPPNHGLEMWIRRPPRRAAPPTAATLTERLAKRVKPTPKTARVIVARYPIEGSSQTPTYWEHTGAHVTGPEPETHPAGGELVTNDASTRFPIPGSPSKRTIAANARNAARIQLANSHDQLIIGESRTAIKNPSNDEAVHPKNIAKIPTAHQEQAPEATAAYLSADANEFLPAAVCGPDDTFTPPAWFLAALVTIARTEITPPTMPPFKFVASAEAAEYNGKILARAGFDIGRVLDAHGLSTLGYGCEFRPPEQLEPLLGRHRNFALLRDLLTEGMSYYYKVELSEAERVKELDALLARGNHKSATGDGDHVTALLEKDVTHGFSVPIPIDIIRLIPGAAVQPLGMVVQQTLDENGKPKVKRRLTQDLSFSSNPHPAPPRSINKRVDMDMYPEMVFGWCLPRILHFVASLRWHQPLRKILIAKYDYSDAYRRIAHSASAAPQTIAVHEGMGYLALRLTFGGSPNPPTWCMVSEMVTDLANEISQCEDWDPTTLYNPVQPVAPKPIYLADSDAPCLPALEMAVRVPPISWGKVDGFIDDLIHVFWDTPSNLERLPHAVPLAMFVTSRPHAGDEREPLPRRDILSLPKLMAEGAPAESQIVLGWRVNTREMTIGLPGNKFADWTGDIQKLIDKRRGTFGEVESLAGRLGHASYAIPLTRHFLERIERTASRPDARKAATLELSDDVVRDLELWKIFLTKANRGVSINLVTIRKPTRICWSDACPFGIGGYSLATGKAWRVKIPSESILFGHPGINNLLEFLGMVVNVWLECKNCQDTRGEEHACILALGDNTSAIGWLHKSASLGRNRPAHAAHLFAARHLATQVLAADCCLASQHIRGVHNIVSDLLSYSGNYRGKPHPLAADNPPDDVLTQRFHSSYPEQIPSNFEICRLPDAVISWLSEALQMAASLLLGAKRVAMKTEIEPGVDGSDSNRRSDFRVTPTSLGYPSTNKAFLPKPSSKPYAPSSGLPPVRLTECVRDQWWRTLCGRPQASWVRRFGAISNRAPSTTRMHRTCDPSSVPSCKPTLTKTPQPSANALSHLSCSGECIACPGPNCQNLATPISPLPVKLQSWVSSSPCDLANATAPPLQGERESSPSKASSSGTHRTR